MATTSYDVIVIGAGPGGYVAAIRAAQLGLKTAVVEREHLGGICLNWGCIPTKALLRNAEVINLMKRGNEFGITFDAPPKVDYAVAQKRSRQVADRLSKGVGFLLKKNQIEHVTGEGRLRSATTVEVGPGGQVLEASKGIILATGARARLFPGLQADGQRVLTYHHALAQTTVPKRIVIVGAGPIGVEFAYVFRSYGSEVTVLEMMPRAVPLEDEEVSAELERAMKRQGTQLRAGMKVDGVEVQGEEVKVQATGSAGTETFVADQVLVAVSVQPNSENLGLEAVGVATQKGWIQVDGYLRTNVKGVYAIGDVTGKMALAHVAEHQGIVAAEVIAGHETRPIEDYTFMPRCVYCQPQIASLGLTEAQAKEKGYQIKVGKFPFQPNGKALAMAEREGFVKVIADAKYGEILGVHMIGPEVTELLPEFTLARTWEFTVSEIGHTVHAHPTLSEALMEAALGVEGKSIHI
ncbi:MAG: dihydrolipoyl dehydrogenase [Anaerolineae bacterium]|nr:dihydrolipoyl dehydrogenase [Anaerolineae bacterium]